MKKQDERQVEIEKIAKLLLETAKAEINAYYRGLIPKKKTISCLDCPQQTLKPCLDKWRCEQTIDEYNQAIQDIHNNLKQRSQSSEH